MTKQDLVNEVAKAGITKEQAALAVNAVFDAIKDALTKGDKVSLVGFGTFGVKERRAREGRNPRTGKRIIITAQKVPVFKMGKGLKEAI